MAIPNTDRDRLTTWKVIRVLQENHDIWSLYLEGANEKMSLRKTGQFVSLMIMTADGWSKPHPFTIASAPEDPVLCLTIKKEGKFTSVIPALQPGMDVRCIGPFGNFCRDIDTRPHIIMLAGGVCITPFLSVLRHFRHIKANNHVTLFWANKTIEDTFSLTELREMTSVINLLIVHCLSREDDVRRHNDASFPRMVFEQGRLNNNVLKKYGIVKDGAFYLCGSPLMMEAVLAELTEFGVAKEEVQVEKF